MKKRVVCLVILITMLFCANVYADFTPLEKGSKGDTVKEVQTALIENKYLNDVADGSFGAKTEAAVSDFQKANNLEVTGIVDETTYNLLIKKGNNTNVSTSTYPKVNKMRDSVSYSSNSKDTVKNGNSGVYAYKSKGGVYTNYYMVDFDAGYVYFFSDGNGDATCDCVKIDSGTLNDVVIITYHDAGSEWSEGLHFKWKNQPDTLVVQDEDGFENEFYTADIDKAVSIRTQKTPYYY